jgi:hypothetical protein
MRRCLPGARRTACNRLRSRRPGPCELGRDDICRECGIGCQPEGSPVWTGQVHSRAADPAPSRCRPLGHRFLASCRVLLVPRSATMIVCGWHCEMLAALEDQIQNKCMSVESTGGPSRRGGRDSAVNPGRFQQVKCIFGELARRIDTAPGWAPYRHWKHLGHEALGEPIFYAEIMKYVEFNRLQGDYAEFGVYQGASFIS